MKFECNPVEFLNGKIWYPTPLNYNRKKMNEWKNIIIDVFTDASFSQKLFESFKVNCIKV